MMGRRVTFVLANDEAQARQLAVTEQSCYGLVASEQGQRWLEPHTTCTEVTEPCVVHFEQIY